MDTPSRPLSVNMILRQLLYVSYIMPSARIRPFVPSVLPLATVGEDQVFVSVVILKCIEVRLAPFPWLPARYNQLNIRTYVRHPSTGEIGIYFLKSAITSRLMLVITRLLGLPWEYAKLTVNPEEAAPDEGRRYGVSGSYHGEIFVDGYQTGRPLGNVEPFATARELMAYLTTPSVAFFTQKNTTKLFRASHEYVDPSVVQITSFRFPHLISLGLVDPTNLNAPHNALLVPEAPFVIHLPPRKLS